MEKQIVFTIDENYVQHLCVVLTSIGLNCDTYDMVFHIISPQLTPKEENLIRKNAPNGNIEFLYIDDTLFDGYYVSNHISKATYYRLLIPKLLGDNIVKVLFLDADIIVRKDLSALFNLNLEGKSHGGVINLGFNRHDSLGMPEKTSYFNAGIMLINLAYWRTNNVAGKVSSFIANNNSPNILINWDQDALNAVLFNQWKEVSPTYNFQTSMFSQKNMEFLKLSKDPAIIHFTGSHKPWKNGSTHPFKREYYYYLKRSIQSFKLNKLHYLTHIIVSYFPIILQKTLMRIFKF